MSKVFVTGGAGYVGSHACKVLAQANFEPVVFDNLSTGHRKSVKWGPLVEGDLGDDAAIRDALRDHAPVAVMHFAGSAYVGESIDNPGKYYRNNVANSINLFAAMRDVSVPVLIFSSSCSVYGIPEKVPITESSPQRPISPYGATKSMIERMLLDADAGDGLRSISFRYFNAAGADPDGEIGEIHDPEPHLIPRALMAVDGELSHLDIFGTDYPTPDGTAIRDYVHVTDLADAHVRGLQYLLDGGETAAINLGTGKGASVRQVIDLVDDITGSKVPTEKRERRAGDPPELVAAPGRATEIIGFKPVFSDLRQIIETAWNWHRTTAMDR